MTRWYCTLDAIKDELGDTGTANDARLRRYIASASRAIEDMTGRTFVPVTDTKRFDAPDNDWLFLSYEDLSSLIALEDGTGAIPVEYCRLYPLNMTPKHTVMVDAGAFGRGFEYDDPLGAIAVTGRWGYCEDVTPTGLVLSADVANTTATAIVLSGAGCEVGWTLLVDTEAMFVLAVSGNVATVERGANGTTAATHKTGAVVSRYVVPADIEQACLEMAIATNNTRTSGGIRQESIGEYSVSYGASAAIPPTAQATLRRYRRASV